MEKFDCILSKLPACVYVDGCISHVYVSFSIHTERVQEEGITHPKPGPIPNLTVCVCVCVFVFVLSTY